MKITPRKSLLLGVAVLGASSALSALSPAPSVAAPRDRNRRDVAEARRDLQRERRDVRRADTPAERRRERRDVAEARRDLQRERRQDRFNPRGNPRGNGSRAYGRSYTGTVTNVRSSTSFDVRLNGNTFNVYTTSRLPRALSVGDVVRVNGTQMYNNDIRNASVSVISNR